MLIERGVVSQVDSQSITVNCRSKIDCIRCAQGKGCGGGILARWLGDRQFSVKSFYDYSTHAPNIGDFVAIGLPANRIVKLAAIMYGIPLAVMMACLIVQVTFLPKLPELLVIAIAILALIIGFKLSSLYVDKANSQGLMLPTLIDNNSELLISLTNCKNRAESL